MSIAQHIIIRPADSRPIFMDLATRRLFTRKVVTIGAAFELIGWGAGDNHGHVGVMGGDPRPAAELARRLESSLTHELGLSDGFAPAKVKAVTDQSHLYSTLPYMVGQGDRHHVGCDPFHEGSSLPDMIGFRSLLPGLPERLLRVAPRFDPERLVPVLGPSPARDDAGAWAEAVVAVIGRAITGRGARVRAARRAVVELATDASVGALCEALSCGPRTVRRLRIAPPSPPAFLEAIIGQARWRNGARTAHVALEGWAATARSASARCVAPS